MGLDMKKNQNNQDSRSECDQSRRDFLRKSVYAAYATPVITALLVEQASAKASADDNKGQCKKAGGIWVNGQCIFR